MNQHISLILLFKNEQSNIKSNFTWLKKCPTINEIIAINDESTDKSSSRLLSYSSTSLKIKIFNHKLTSFSSQRQLAVSKTSNNWILWLDCDEKPDKKMLTFLNNFDFNQYLNFTFKRSDYFLGKYLKFGENGKNKYLRLFTKDSGLFLNDVHEVWISSKLEKPGQGTILHHSASSLNQHIQKINSYSTIRANQLFLNHKKVNLFHIIFLPLAKFIINYIFLFAFLDGFPGLVFSLSLSFYTFLVRSKLWHLYQN